MSQEKVAKYKAEKANRKQTVKKQKREKMIRSSIAGIVLVAIVGWIGYSGVTYYQENRPRKTVEVDYNAVDDFISGVSGE